MANDMEHWWAFVWDYGLLKKDNESAICVCTYICVLNAKMMAQIFQLIFEICHVLRLCIICILYKGHKQMYNLSLIEFISLFNQI
jgi:hypothetical protein